MPTSPSILQVNTYDDGGGAEQICRQLHESYQERGLSASLAVGRRKLQTGQNIWEIPRSQNRWISALSNRISKLPFSGFGLPTALRRLSRPEQWVRHLMGHEDFSYPKSWDILKTIPTTPDLIHFHNLHGAFFDLRSLRYYAEQLPVFFTLHDCWLFTGHCAYFFECHRWEDSCGSCPHLDIYPSISRDGSKVNIQLKREIVSGLTLNLATPSQWLANQVEKSILREMPCKVIPNGIDLNHFKVGDRQQARQKRNLPSDAFVLLCVGSQIKSNPFKDFPLLKEAVSSLKTGRNTLLLVLGEDRPDESWGEVLVKYLPPISNRKDIAEVYQSCDVFLHPTREDNFPNVILEAHASGRVTIAPSVGGISEQILANETGLITKPGDVKEFREAIETIASAPDRQKEMENAARVRAENCFSLTLQTDRYLEWYASVLSAQTKSISAA